ncbi:MAG: hypothetical protein CMJ46_13195 [Planctomyces sp.]|nr:hypothetical protein [Planctomyces sp.]
MPAPSSVRSIDPWLWRLFLIAVGVRIVYFLFFLNSPFAVLQLTDQAYYRNWGIAISHGDLLGNQAYEQGPAYAWWLGLLYTLGFSDTAVIVLQLFLGATLAALIYSSAIRLKLKPAAAIAAGVMTALYGPLMYHEAMIMKSWLSPLCTSLVLTGTLHFIGSKKVRWLWLTGIAIGIVSLSRENHLLMIFPVIACLWLWRKDYAPVASWKAMAIPVVALCLTIAPATIRNYLVAHEFVLVTAGGGEVMYMAHGPYAKANYNPPPFIRPNPYFEHEDFRKEAARQTGRPLSRSESSRYWSNEATKTITSDPLNAASLTFWKGFNLVNNFEVPDNQNFLITRDHIPLLYVLPRFSWYFGLAIFGLWLARRDWRMHILPVGLILVHVVTILIFYNFDRFRIGLVPVMTIYAGSGLIALYEYWKEFRSTENTETRPAFRRRLIAGIVIVTLGTVISLLPPHDVNASFYRGLAQESAQLEEMARVGEARDLARDAVDNFPQQPQGWLMLAQTEYTLSQFEEAKRAADTGIALSPSEQELLALLDVKVDALIGLRETEEAEEVLKSTINEYPNHLSAYVKLATLQVEKYETKAAIDTLDRALARNDRNTGLWFNRGNIAALHCFSPKLYGEANAATMCAMAEESFRRAVELNPKDARILVKLTDYQLRSGDIEAALDSLQQGIELRPDAKEYAPLFPEALRQMGARFSEEEQQRFLAIVKEFYEQMAASRDPELAPELIDRLLPVARELKLDSLAADLQKIQE